MHFSLLNLLLLTARLESLCVTICIQKNNGTCLQNVVVLEEENAM